MLLGNKLLKTYHENVFGERQAMGERGHLVLPRTYFETHCFVLWLKMQHTFSCIGTWTLPGGSRTARPSCTDPAPAEGLETVIGHQAYKLQPHRNTLILIITPIYHKITVSQGYYYPTGGV